MNPDTKINAILGLSVGSLLLSGITFLQTSYVAFEIGRLATFLGHWGM